MIEIGSGNTFRNCQLSSSDGRLILNGKEIPKPPVEMKNVTIINNHVYVGGYEYKDGEWKKTLKALFYKHF